jgi:lipoate-protein ligase A
MQYILNPCTDAQWNMAHDEFLLERLEGSVFCLWQNAPAVIIGLNQNAHAEVNLPFLEGRGIRLARRVTGGGAVYHDLGNLNYSIAGPAREVEKQYDTVAAALRQLGVPAIRSGRNDILVDGRKCSGYAKRLSRDRMMIHGTLMWDVDLETLTQALAAPGGKLAAAGIASVRSRVANLKPFLPQFDSLELFRDALHGILADGDGEIQLSPAQISEIDRMADEKFRRWEWIIGHSPAASFCVRKKFPCGTVEAAYSLRHGVLESLSFQGDFLGNRPADELAGRLMGKALEAVLEENVQAYFDGLDAQQLYQFLLQ